MIMGLSVAILIMGAANIFNNTVSEKPSTFFMILGIAQVTLSVVNIIQLHKIDVKRNN